MARTQVRGTGVQVEGLAESIAALGRVDKDLQKEAKEVFRREAVAVQATAKSNADAHPSAPSRKGWIGRSVTNKGAGVKLNPSRTPRAHATEWGMHRAWVFGRPTIQRALRRRTFRRFEGSQFSTKRNAPGYVIQPAIAAHLPGMERRVADDLNRVFDKALDRAGVPKGVV